MNHEDYSLPELYNIPASGPTDPTKINWTSVALYSAISLTTVVALGLIVNISVKSSHEKWIDHSKEMNEKLLSTIKSQQQKIDELQSQLQHERWKASKNSEPDGGSIS